MPTTAKPVEIAPFDAREGVVTLVTVGGVLWFYAALALVAGGPSVPWQGGTWLPGALLLAGVVCMVGALVVNALRSR
jgi:hypothetical protein